eukprot:839781-Pleurochrysis_carterae.AAC.1
MYFDLPSQAAQVLDQQPRVSGNNEDATLEPCKHKVEALTTRSHIGGDGALRAAVSAALCEQWYQLRSTSSGVSYALRAAALTALCEQRRWLRSASSGVERCRGGAQLQAATETRPRCERRRR